MLIPGCIGAKANKNDAGEGITRMSYYDNSWEVMAYGIMNPTGRDVAKDLIWGWVGSVIVCALYILAATTAGVALLAVRLLGLASGVYLTSKRARRVLLTSERDRSSVSATARGGRPWLEALFSCSSWRWAW